MTAERWRQIEKLFAEVVERPAAEQASFLEQVCAGDDELRRELESLLACDIPDQSLVDIPAEDTVTGEAAPEWTGKRVGHYRLLGLIGHGGMGAVYLGVRDDDQYQKQVAIKLLKRGMDTDFMLSRFRQERQILANLEHPFIARLLDGGATEDGLPYFVMEYVDGVPITQYCAEKNLSVPERLRLFRLVCEAVQHAHQNLVVHRDIKPSNILTTKEGVPKLVDFGIAKVFGPAASEMTLTLREFRMLTPEYASPEQVKGVAIGTASDIYSLGVVLYELLSGRRAHRFASNAPGDMERTICEIEPERPSSAVSRNEDISVNVRRQWKRQLAGDLDTIVLTAVRKEPERRYASIAGFSEDIRRHMEALPILAREDRWSYRTGKFLRRNKLAVGAGLLLAATLIGGIVTTRMEARRAERRFQLVRGLAHSNLFELQDEMERLPGSTALRAATLRTVVKYLDDLAADGSPDPSLDFELAGAYVRAGDLEGHPFQSNLGRGDAALTNYKKALTILERLASLSEFRPRALPRLIDAHLNAAQLSALLGAPAAAALHTRQAAGMVNEAFAGGNFVSPSTRINVFFRLADGEYDHGNAAGELAYYRNALEVNQKWAANSQDPAADGSLRDSYRNVASALARNGDLYGALETYRRGQEVGERLARRPDARLDQQYNSIGVDLAIGDVLAAPDDPNLGDSAGALAQYRTAFETAQRFVAADAGNVNARRTLAVCYQRLGMLFTTDKPREALEYSRKSLEIADALGAGDPQNAEYRYHVSRASAWLGEALHNLGREDEALRHLNRTIEFQNAIEAVSPERIWNLRVLTRAHVLKGAALLGKGDRPEALLALQGGLAVADRMLERAPSSLPHLLDRADALEAIGAYHLSRKDGAGKAAARASYEKSLAIWKDWTARKLASPYAEKRLNRTAAILVGIERP